PVRQKFNRRIVQIVESASLVVPNPPIRQLYDQPTTHNGSSVVRGRWSVDWLGPWLIRNQAQSAGVFVAERTIIHPEGRSPDVYIFSPRSTVHSPRLIRWMIEVRSTVDSR